MAIAGCQPVSSIKIQRLAVCDTGASVTPCVGVLTCFAKSLDNSSTRLLDLDHPKTLLIQSQANESGLPLPKKETLMNITIVGRAATACLTLLAVGFLMPNAHASTAPITSSSPVIKS